MLVVVVEGPPPPLADVEDDEDDDDDANDVPADGALARGVSIRLETKWLSLMVAGGRLARLRGSAAVLLFQLLLT